MNKANKILMFGPAYGHNIKPFFNFFSTNTNYQLTFVYSSDIAKENESLASINFFKLTKSISKLLALIKLIRESNYIWHQGGYNLLELMVIYLFKKSDSIFIINVWGEQIPKTAITKTFSGKLYKFFYNKSDVVSCLWYGTKKILDEIVSPDKVKVLLWGLESSYFDTEKFELMPFTQNFIAQMPKDKKVFFYPKSFTEASDHDVIIESAKQLVDQGEKQFVIYFWTGNVTNQQIEQSAIDKIKAYQLEENVLIIYHDFIPFYDIIKIWEQVDVGLQIVKNDQLSTTFLEPLVLGKEILVSDIYPYRKIIEHYPSLELKLTVNDPLILAKEMQDLIDGGKTPSNVIAARKEIIEKEFNFEKNIQKMMDYYIQLLSNKN